MIRVWTAILFMCLPSLALAQAISVRTGEHSGFTRLVLDVPRTVPWVVKKGEVYSIELQELEAEFDLSGTLARLNSGRILGLAAAKDGTALEVTVNCDCETRSFFVGERMLVVDFVGDIRDQTAEVQIPEADVSPEIETPERPVFRLPLIFPGTRLPQQRPQTEAKTLDVGGLSEEELARAEQSREAEIKLLEKLSRAASQGLVEPHLTTVQPQVAKEAEPTPAEEDIVENITPAVPEGKNIRAFSSVDRDFLVSREGRALNRDGNTCMEDSELALHSWISSEGFGAQISDLRSSLYGEFDRPNVEAAVGLIKAYIGYGLGQEAEQLVTQVGGAEAPAHLLALADIIEDGDLRGPLPDGWFSDCDGAAALWALLAARDVGDTVELNEPAIIRSFSSLPTHLRAHLAPFVSNKLKMAGREHLLPDIVRHTKRGQPDEIDNVALVSAQAKAMSDEPTSALEDLEKVVQANGENAPQALIQKLDLLIADGQIIDERDAALAEAFAIEYRKEDLAADLSRVAILSRVSSGEYEGSLEALAALSDRLDGVQHSESASYVLGAITEKADDLTFLQSSFAPELETLLLSTVAEHGAARRLLGLGFPARALILLSTAAQGDLGRERKLIRAQASLQLGRVRQAEAELLGLHGADVEEIRLKAKIGQEDHHAAKIVLETLGDAEAAAEQAWLAEDWNSLGDLETESWRSEQELVAIEPNLSRDSSLAAGEALLNETADLRRLIGDVLQNNEVSNALPLN